jgi:hypothetical protein
VCVFPEFNPDSTSQGECEGADEYGVFRRF